MALVQMAFFNFVAYPRAFGGLANEEADLLDLAYFWRVAGYYLGLSDE